MAEQSLRERLHSTHTLATGGRPRGLFLIGAAVGIIAAVYLGTTVAPLWAAPGVILAVACLWGFVARGAHRLSRRHAGP